MCQPGSSQVVLPLVVAVLVSLLQLARLLPSLVLPSPHYWEVAEGEDHSRRVPMQDDDFAVGRESLRLYNAAEGSVFDCHARSGEAHVAVVRSEKLHHRLEVFVN